MGGFAVLLAEDTPVLVGTNETALCALGSTASALARALIEGDKSRPDLSILPTKDGRTQKGSVYLRIWMHDRHGMTATTAATTVPSR